MKESLNNAIILYLIIVVGTVFINDPLFFSSGYNLKKNNIIDLPNFVIFVIITAVMSLYIAKIYTV